MILNFLKGFSVNGKRIETDFENKILKGEKLHTVRGDSMKRWKAGVKIHFCTGAQSSRYKCFKESICKGVQEIEIIDRDIYIDGAMLKDVDVQDFAINDGFDDLDCFWAWFDQYTPFEGRVIHWSDIRY